MEQALIGKMLEQLKAEGRSSPSGLSWDNFHKMLCRYARPEATRPPMPLILAASSESDDTKHRRLAEHLEWAHRNGCLDEALQFLNELEPEKWNQSTLENWNRSNNY